METNVDGSCIITNMSEEMFNDALFYKEKVDNTDDFFLIRRYRRNAIILFCASAEAWMNNTIKDNLEKKTSLTADEQEILDFIVDYNSKMPRGFSNVKNKLYNFIPRAIIGKSVDWNNEPQDVFEEYIRLSNMRNNVIHYASKNSDVFYNENFITLIHQAPDIIESLFQKYESMGSTLGVPSWYKKRESRII